MNLHINLPGYEDLRLELDQEGKIISYQLECSRTLLQVFKLKLATEGLKPAQWKVSVLALEDEAEKEKRRAHILMNEILRRAQGDWQRPYDNQIVCQCMQVSAAEIDEAIVVDANSVEQVAAWTSACITCTSCRPKIEEILKNRRG